MKRKRIDLLAPPFKGHLHPILAIGRLLAESYDVTVLSTKSAKSDIEAAGLRAKLLTSIDDKFLIECVNPTHAVRSSPLLLLTQFKQVLTFFHKLKTELEIIYSSQKPDLIIADFTLPIAGIIAKQKQIPWWTSMPSPCVIECSGGTPSYLGGWKESQSLPFLFRDWLGRKLVRFFKSAVALLCKKHIKGLGLQQIYRQDGTEAIYSQDVILCLAYQELEFSRPWPKAVHFTGPMLYSPALLKEHPVFQENKKHVLITVGTHLDWCKDSIYRAVENLALKFPDVIFHFSDGNTHKHTYSRSQKNCMRFPYINYGEHLPEYDYVIHHGGAGIMYRCIQHAKPSIVIPQDYDQFDHAARLATLGLAIWLNKLDDLPAAFQTLCTSSETTNKLIQFRERCSASTHTTPLPHLVEQYLKS